MRSQLKNKTIAFVTSNAYADLTPSDCVAADALRNEGARVVPAIWDDASIDWTKFDLIIIRSPWDYHLHADRFIGWIDSLERKRLNVLNPTMVLRWNMDKRYLLDLTKKNIPIPHTYFFDSNESFDVSAMRSLLGTDEVVIKPAVSASGWNTWRCSLEKFSGEDHQRLKDLPGGMRMMVQEFMPEIGTEGEWSLVFFGEQFSHAVRKYPGKGEFRVQEELGGRYSSELNPPTELIRQGRDVLATIDGPLLYARVDGIVRSGTFVMMELELLEPSLYFDVNPAAVKPFVERVAELITVV